MAGYGTSEKIGVNNIKKIRYLMQLRLARKSEHKEQNHQQATATTTQCEGTNECDKVISSFSFISVTFNINNFQEIYFILLSECYYGCTSKKQHL